jgi:hypothetical protein
MTLPRALEWRSSMNRTRPTTTTIRPTQLDDLIHRDLLTLESHLQQGLDSRFPIPPRTLERVVRGKMEIQEWRNALHRLRIEALRNTTPEHVQQWMQPRQQMVLTGPFGIRLSLVPHRTRHYELDH